MTCKFFINIICHFNSFLKLSIHSIECTSISEPLNSIFFSNILSNKQQNKTLFQEKSDLLLQIDNIKNIRLQE